MKMVGPVGLESMTNRLSGTYTRDCSFTEDGKACTSNIPLPVAALEGGVSEPICIELMDEPRLLASKVAAPRSPVIDEVF